MRFARLRKSGQNSSVINATVSRTLWPTHSPHSQDFACPPKANYTLKLPQPPLPEARKCWVTEAAQDPLPAPRPREPINYS